MDISLYQSFPIFHKYFLIADRSLAGFGALTIIRKLKRLNLGSAWLQPSPVINVLRIKGLVFSKEKGEMSTCNAGKTCDVINKGVSRGKSWCCAQDNQEANHANFKTYEPSKARYLKQSSMY